MDAVEYTKTLRRLCESQANCPECPLHENCEEDNYGYCNGNASEYVEKSVHIVEQWAKDHPVKTRQSEFLKMFPKAEIKDDYLWMCPKYINYDYNPEENCHEISCSDCKRKFWLTEVTDND
jgi:hypothetical protein